MKQDYLNNNELLTIETLDCLGFEIFKHSNPPLYHIRNGEQISWEESSHHDIQLYTVAYNEGSNTSSQHFEVWCDEGGETPCFTVSETYVLIKFLKACTDAFSIADESGEDIPQNV
jgi:hypothetical protein